MPESAALITSPIGVLAAPGSYTVRAFVWESLGNPVSLTTPEEITIIVEP